MKIITVSREFGSGGREVGKRLADALGFAYYDREILTAVAESTQLSEDYVARALTRPTYANMSLHFGRTFSYTPTVMVDLFVEQHKAIKQLAEMGDCVIVGRAADVVLKDYNPFNLFVYADMPSKIARCRSRDGGEEMTDRAIEKMIKKIDGDRRKMYALFSDAAWGDKSNYHLCVNTSGREIKTLIPQIAQYAELWLKNR